MSIDIILPPAPATGRARCLDPEKLYRSSIPVTDKVDDYVAGATVWAQDREDKGMFYGLSRPRLPGVVPVRCIVVSREGPYVTFRPCGANG